MGFEDQRLEDTIAERCKKTGTQPDTEVVNLFNVATGMHEKTLELINAAQDDVFTRISDK